MQLTQSVTAHQQVTFDVSSSVKILNQATEETYDIGPLTTFINVGHPDITTPLIIIALPAGFTLLGLLKEEKLFYFNKSNNIILFRPKSRLSTTLTYMAIVTGISFLGILSHDEFYLFIIIASIAMVVFFRSMPVNVNYSIFFVSFLSAILLVILVDILLSPAKYYTSREILGITLTTICLMFVSFTWSLYLTLRKIKISNILNSNSFRRRIKIVTKQAIKNAGNTHFLNDHQIRFLKLSLGIVIVSAVAYFYLFTAMVWDELSVDEIHIQIEPESNVPWYIYPMKFGLTGLLGIAYLLSYLFKKFEKEIFIFGVITVVAFLAGPYYDEHRFGKYIMAGMAAFAALLIYQIISSHMMEHKLKLNPLIVGVVLGLVVTSSSLSIFIYAGYVELFAAISHYTENSRRDFPTKSELELLNHLSNEVIGSKAANIAVPEKEVGNSNGFVTKIYGFTPIPRVKLLQSPLTLNASTLEGLYNLLDQNDVRYILLLKKDVIAHTVKESVASSISNKYDENVGNVVRFALDNFPKSYEDRDYIVLEALPLAPKTLSGSDVALIYGTDFHELLPSVSTERTVLAFNSGFFTFHIENSSKNNSNYNNSIINNIEEQNKNLAIASNTLTLDDNISNNSKDRTVLWSRPIQEFQQNDDISNGTDKGTIINYIESTFREIDDIRIENKTEKESQNKSFGTGILWEHENKHYRVSIAKDSLKLSQSPSNTNQFITTDLGSIQNVCSVDIAWYSGNSRQYHFVIATSTDGTAFTNKFSGYSSGTTLNSEKYTFESTDARYSEDNCQW